MDEYSLAEMVTRAMVLKLDAEMMALSNEDIPEVFIKAFEEENDKLC